MRYLAIVLFLFILQTQARAYPVYVHSYGSITVIEPYDSSAIEHSVQLHFTNYHQTTNYTCGPAAVMTLLYYYGKLNARDLNRHTELRIASEMGAVIGDSGGTTAFQIEGWLSHHGFDVELKHNINTDVLIENLKQGIPIILLSSNHWVLAKGYRQSSTPEGDEVFFSDSVYNLRVMSRSIIDSMWIDNAGYYLVAVPKK